ncbi:MULTISPECIES: CO2 hydration protein [Trichocoleus]|uniref:CO2 hydration protein n=1 Tax=Trichocoleus desertorum GB2-A4 TaxID=2933944 RepID=A0ABV0J162_9CYAN|nr:CO2 hydration protein [Trichocoleus sp. FACHB-46]MBD1860125.1 CO2 hydration protein [Trichocoleus sp. FACHB-46]
MVSTIQQPSNHPLAEYVHRLEAGEALLANSQVNVLEVVGILKSYGIVLDAYSKNLIYIADHQFLELFPFFKYFNGEVSLGKLLRFWNHDRINYEYAEYVMKTMLWHGGGDLDTYLDSPEFLERAQRVMQAKTKNNWLVSGLQRVFPDFLPEQIRQLAYYKVLGLFWRVMSDMFIDLSDRFDRKEVQSIAEVVQHVQDALVAAANQPLVYAVEVKGQVYDIIPESAGLTFLMDAAVPYVDTIFFRGTPFLGTVSYNAQAQQIPVFQDQFIYGALYADPLPIGGAGIPPTLLMQDMRHFLPDYLHDIYRQGLRGEDDLRVKICESFQKSMFCVTTAAIRGLMPHPLDTEDPKQRQANRAYLEKWMDRFIPSRLEIVNVPDRY